MGAADNILGSADSSPEPADDSDREEREVDPEKQDQELDDMLADTSPGEERGTEGASDPTDEVDGDEVTYEEKIEEERQKAKAELAEERGAEPEPDYSEPRVTQVSEVGTRSVEEVLEEEDAESVDDIIADYGNDLRTTVPTTCELGCGVKPGEVCAHGHPPVTDL